MYGLGHTPRTIRDPLSGPSDSRVGIAGFLFLSGIFFFSCQHSDIWFASEGVGRAETLTPTLHVGSAT